MAEGRRLSDIEILTAAGNEDPPQFDEGQRVRVLFSVQDPIEGVVSRGNDDRGWIKVRDDDGLEFEALAACTVAIEG